MRTCFFVGVLCGVAALAACSGDDDPGTLNAKARNQVVADAGVQQTLEPSELVAIREDDLGDRGSVGRPEALLQGGPHVGIARDQAVHDLVARANG